MMHRSMQGLKRQPIARVAGQMREMRALPQVRISRRCRSCGAFGEHVLLVNSTALCPRCAPEAK